MDMCDIKEEHVNQMMGHTSPYDYILMRMIKQFNISFLKHQYGTQQNQVQRDGKVTGPLPVTTLYN